MDRIVEPSTNRYKTSSYYGDKMSLTQNDWDWIISRESSFPHRHPCLSKMELFFHLWIPGYVLLLLGSSAKAEEQFPLTEWTTAYSMTGEQEIAKESRLITLPQLTKEWKVSFEVNPTDYKYTSYASLLHMTIGGNRVQVGDRSPAIWLHKTRGVLISSTIDGKVSYGKTVKPLM